MSYKKVNILELANMLPEDCLKELLCSFACPLNSDIENFIRFKCLSFAKQKLSVSHLVFDEMENLLGFFTLANKPCLIRNDTVTSELSNTLKKKLDRFATQSTANGIIVPAYLIAQFGKNYAIEKSLRIDGKELMRLAFETLSAVQREIGGGVIFLECRDEQKLLEFYTSDEIRFREYGQRRALEDGEDILYHQLLHVF